MSKNLQTTVCGAVHYTLTYIILSLNILQTKFFKFLKSFKRELRNVIAGEP